MEAFLLFSLFFFLLFFLELFYHLCMSFFPPFSKQLLLPEHPVSIHKLWLICYDYENFKLCEPKHLRTSCSLLAHNNSAWTTLNSSGNGWWRMWPEMRKKGARDEVIRNWLKWRLTWCKVLCTTGYVMLLTGGSNTPPEPRKDGGVFQ